MDDLRRRCERAGVDEAGIFHRAACPLFWTMGGQQVGKAAILGWSQVLEPGLSDPNLRASLWPFEGGLEELLQPGNLVIVETYPTEFYHHLGVRFPRRGRGQKSGKRVQSERGANAGRLLEWLAHNPVEIEPDLERMIVDGFGPSGNGDDRFDAVVGLLGMLNIVFGHHPGEAPKNERLRKVEGWIFGKSIT
jgi:hypothetical protein